MGCAHTQHKPLQNSASSKPQTSNPNFPPTITNSNLTNPSTPSSTNINTFRPIVQIKPLPNSTPLPLLTHHK